ncbi:hypothetical protein [Proteus mirabilis]|uniref:hypothetical protein n=1 Tax=Proteus mirabilis TaxID=584 RepID=UPI000D9CE3B2|nr:hypothetical protein [Proteus mirabilis]MBI6248867.1 hypothetical protein [Proteus mirabilis]SPY42728.1 Uncharacterised protein [Proteus mirabilis]SPY45014.1 Uncharacterised protein [Proteus mirabilis]HEK1791997.1 hypothetical protein [Proteus mirabilis]HEK3113443.1 hypothetical protein [Proteus mirabilis]
MDKSRQQFEEAIKQLSDPSEFESKLKRANNGLNYADQYVDLMWISWQASRESLEIELPDKYTLEYMQDDLSDSECDFFKCDDVKNELSSNGVKIKNE